MNLRNANPKTIKTSRGFVLMAAALLLGMVSMAVLLFSLSSTDAATQQAIKTQLALKEAKEAVLGYILLDSGTTMKPGSVPCPDQDNDNDSDFYDYAGDCKYGIYTYRFPGKQFRTGELRDSANEKLWYAISPAFRAGSGAALNSLTPATIQIDGRGEYVAAVIAPGAPLAGQGRTDPTVRAHFLEYSNATGTPQLITPATVPPSDQLNFNDRLIGISHKEWEDTVVRRVASEFTAKLKDYLTTRTHLPWASPLIASPTRTLEGSRGIYSGFLPVKELWPEPVPRPPAYTVTQAQKNEDWFADNEWYKLIYYVVAPAFVDDRGARNCDILADCLTLKTNGKVITGIKALVIYAGVALVGQNRNHNGADPTVADYLEGAENRNGNNVFEAAPTGPNANDRFYIIR